MQWNSVPVVVTGLWIVLGLIIACVVARLGIVLRLVITGLGIVVPIVASLEIYIDDSALGLWLYIPSL